MPALPKSSIITLVSQVFSSAGPTYICEEYILQSTMMIDTKENGDVQQSDEDYVKHLREKKKSSSRNERRKTGFTGKST